MLNFEYEIIKNSGGVDSTDYLLDEYETERNRIEYRNEYFDYIENFYN